MGGAVGNPPLRPRGSFCCSSRSIFFGGEGRFLHVFLEELGGKSAVAPCLLVHEGLLQVFPPSPTTRLSSVPFSFGSDMGDHFIVPCGACRQVMREVTACAGPPHLLTPGISPQNTWRCKEGGCNPPVPSLRVGSRLLKFHYLPGKGYSSPCPVVIH